MVVDGTNLFVGGYFTAIGGRSRTNLATNIEGDETFTVTLTGASGGIVAYPGIATVTIIDDECSGQHGSFTNNALPFAGPAATGASI